jgi:multimeric flavodoxin WrbA
MKAFIVNGATADDRTLNQAQEKLSAELTKRGWEVKTLCLAEQTIAPCTGCFTCWVKTPGICARNDDGRKMPGLLMDPDLFIMLTPVVYGGYGPLLKTALDRSIPILLPFFRVVQGEIHHPTRYGQHYNLLAIGSLPAPDAQKEGIFANLVGRNALNMSSPLNYTGVLYQSDDDAAINAKLNSYLQKAGVAK